MSRHIPRRPQFAALAAALLLAACGDDPAGPIPGGGDPENISNITVTLTPVGGGTALTSTIRDPDGTQLSQPPGAASATLALRQGVTYNAAIDLLNDLDPNNIVSTTEEIEEEANFHRFFYSFSCTGVSAPVSSFNGDDQTPPQPLGTTFQVEVAGNATATTSCAMTVELRHFETDKGDGAGNNFETDISIDFPVSVAP